MSDIYLHLIPRALWDALESVRIDEETGECIGTELLDRVEMAAKEKIAATALYIKDAQGDIDQMDSAIKEMSHRKRAAENRVARLKSLLTDAVKATGPVKTPHVTVSMRKNPASVHLDEGALDTLPPEFVKIEKSARLKDLKDAILKDGQTFPGVSIEQTESLSIRI